MSDDHRHEHWCLAWYEDTPPTTSAERAAMVNRHRWPAGSQIRIAFLDGTAAQQALVKKFAVGWLGPNLARLTFTWTQPATSDIRISFAYRGSWSVIGTTCKNVPKTQPTMNFGWLTPGISDADAQAVILHEFGHALGLIHEHQNPIDSIDWNKPAVIHDLSGPPNNWDLAKIEHNMFEKYPQQEVSGTTLDPTSVMMYPIPASWVNDGKTAGQNKVLSATDKTFIKKMYP